MNLRTRVFRAFPVLALLLAAVACTQARAYSPVGVMPVSDTEAAQVRGGDSTTCPKNYNSAFVHCDKTKVCDGQTVRCCTFVRLSAGNTVAAADVEPDADQDCIVCGGKCGVAKNATSFTPKCKK